MSPKPVLDFLYVDVQRIARLVAQLNQYGLLKDTTKKLLMGGETSTGFGFLLAKLSGSLRFEGSKSGTYDPSWRLPVVFLEDMNKLIVADPTHWQVGQIVSLTGSIAFQDFAFANQMLEIDAIAAAVGSSSMASGGDAADVNAFRGVIKKLPHLLTTTISHGAVKTWSTVNDACTTASTGDLILKCGGTIAGDWTITGILDVEATQTQPSQRAPATRTSDTFARFGDATRACFGRPSDCYGVTPLTVHRTVQFMG